MGLESGVFWWVSELSSLAVWVWGCSASGMGGYLSEQDVKHCGSRAEFGNRLLAAIINSHSHPRVDVDACAPLAMSESHG